MDIIQRTVSIFSALLERIRTIGALLSSSYLSAPEEAEESRRIFWIFNW